MTLSPNTLTLDFEVFPWLAYGYGSHYEPVIAKEVNEQKILCIAYAFGEGPVKFKAIWDFPDYKPKGLTIDDKSLVKFIAEEIFPKADIVAGWNSDKYDLRMLYERMHFYKMTPLQKVKTQDGLKLYRKFFNNPSNTLKYIAPKYGGQGKIGHEGMSAYIKAGLGDVKMQRIIKEYNKRDTAETRDRIRDVMAWEQRIAPVWGKARCEKCGTDNTRKRGTEFYKQLGARYQTHGCNECGHRWPGAKVIEKAR